MRKKFLGLIFIISGIFVFVFATEAKIKLLKEGHKKTDELYQQLELFAETISLIRANYVEEVEIKDLIYGALKGMLVSLDPHSQFMDPDTYNEIKVETEGEFGGLGIVISIKDELLTIISPIDGTPAHKAGLKAGDRIVKIDGVSTKGITLIEAVKKLRGEPGTKVNLTVLREEEKKLLEFTLERAIIKIESIKEAKIIEDKIGNLPVNPYTGLNYNREYEDLFYGGDYVFKNYGDNAKVWAGDTTSPYLKWADMEVISGQIAIGVYFDTITYTVSQYGIAGWGRCFLD
ncbi:MAG: PDZ domain-containing protein, partial [Candidatus Omnitrophica bacterium]|nr:PDZ domain-containing protein [Candidatus Omnitrophota bacterium]